MSDILPGKIGRAPGWSTVSVFLENDDPTDLRGHVASEAERMGTTLELLFTFGTLMDRALQDEMSAGRTVGACVAFARHAALAPIRPPVMYPCADKIVRGILYTVDTGDGLAWQGLDQYEGVPDLYERLQVKLEGCTGTKVWAYAYKVRLTGDGRTGKFSIDEPRRSSY